MADQTIKRSFAGGEIAPALRSRADLAKYGNGLALCENFFPKSQGGAYSRPGFRFVGEIADSSARARLIPFSFNTTQTYILEFGNLTMRVIKDGAYVIDSGAPPALFEMVTTYTTAQLPYLIFTQDADVMTITHPDHDPKTLSRTDHDAWTLANVNFANTPTAPGALTLTAVGTATGSPNKTYGYVVTAVDENDVESLPSAANTITQNALGVTYGVKIDWANVTGAVYYRIYKDPSNGSGVYGWIGDAVNSVFEDYNIDPVTSDSPPSAYTPFGTTDNQPATVGYDSQRTIYANTNTEPQSLFMTQVGNYDSMRSSSPAKDDDAIFITIKNRQVNEIRHIVSLEDLILMTAGAEWRVTKGVDQVLTPYTAGAKPFSTFGSSWVAPAITGDSVIYVQEKGSRIRDIISLPDSKPTGTDLSILAEHLFEDYDIEEMDFSKEPYGILWAVRSDGKLLGLTYQREHGIFAWHQHVTTDSTSDSVFESVAVISEGGRDALYVIVKRTIGAATVRYVERMEPRYTDAAENAFCVDSGLSYNGVPATVFSGLDHLDGEEVAVLADGVVVANQTVVSGSVTLPEAYSVVHIGLPYTPAIELLDLDIASVSETLKGKEISIARVIVEVELSRGGYVAPKADDGTIGTFTEIKPRFQSDGYDPIALKSFKQELVLQPTWNKSGAMRIEQRSPLPLAILSVIPDVDVS